MRQGIQSTLSNPSLKEYGCYFLCLLQWAEMESGRPEFTDRQITFIYDMSVKEEYIKKDCTILFPFKVLNLALLDNKYKTWDVVKAVPSVSRYITYLVKPNYGHFVFQNGNATWDPLDPNRESAKPYRPESYRVIS